VNELQQGLALGFDVAIVPAKLWPLFCGALIGSLAGVLPGIGSVVAIALLLPLVQALGASAALIMLAAVYYGAQYGGSTAAILVNPAGSEGADGYQMARQGRAGRALALAAFGSFFAGCVGTLLIAVVAAPLSRVAQGLGPAEFFSLMLLALVGAVVLASGSLIKGMAMAVIGLLLSQIGIDPGTGTERYRLGIPELAHGIGFAALAIGLLVCGELMARLDRGAAAREVYRERLGWLWPTRRDARAAWPAP
jgi:TctA family transporter